MPLGTITADGARNLITAFGLDNVHRVLGANYDNWVGQAIALGVLRRDADGELSEVR